MNFSNSRLGAVLAIMLLLPAGASSLAANEKGAAAKIIHNNAIEQNGQQFLLYGAVVPTNTTKCFSDDKTWPCGAAATLRLHELLQQDSLICEIVETGTEQRLARCSRADLDIASQLVAEGWALAAAGVDDYLAAEKLAMELNAGIWTNSFVPPDSWRDYRELQFDFAEDLLCSACAARRQ